MPYFERKAIPALVGRLGSHAPIPGLPSRGPAPSTAVAAGTQPVNVSVIASMIATRRERFSDAADLIVEPAPVLAPPGPIAPGRTAQMTVSLVNDDERPARVVFFSTDLIGPDGAVIPAGGVSFEPRELLLPSGQGGDVIVRVVVPAYTRFGVYSGLIRASTLAYLHAVLVVQVEKS